MNKTPPKFKALIPCGQCKGHHYAGNGKFCTGKQYNFPQSWRDR